MSLLAPLPKHLASGVRFSGLPIAVLSRLPRMARCSEVYVRTDFTQLRRHHNNSHSKRRYDVTASCTDRGSRLCVRSLGRNICAACAHHGELPKVPLSGRGKRCLQQPHDSDGKNIYFKCPCSRPLSRIAELIARLRQEIPRRSDEHHAGPHLSLQVSNILVRSCIPPHQVICDFFREL